MAATPAGNDTSIDFVIGSKRLIKDINRARMVAEVRDHGPISRTELSKRTGLVVSTVSKLCDELIAQDLLFESGEGQSTGGRRPVNLSFNNSYGHIVVVKIEHNHFVFAVSNLKPHIVQTFVIEFPLGSPFDSIRELLLTGIDQTVSRIHGPSPRLLGIAIAVSGLVDASSGRLTTSRLLGWENINFVELLGARFDCPVYVDNDVNCYTLSQKWLGKGKGLRDFCCITIGEGVGAGLIVDGALYRGAIGGAGEIGHTIVQGGGEHCYCGQQGCLEAYASSNAIIAAVERDTGERPSIESIVARAREGDDACLDALHRAGRALGWGLVTVITFFNPEKIILGGEGVVEKEFILPIVQAEVDRNWFYRDSGYRTVIEVDELGNENFILGGAILAIDDLLGHPVRGERKSLVINTVS